MGDGKEQLLSLITYHLSPITLLPLVACHLSLFLLFFPRLLIFTSGLNSKLRPEREAEAEKERGKPASNEHQSR
jgi:hypothetical protein